MAFLPLLVLIEGSANLSLITTDYHLIVVRAGARK